MSYFNRKSVEYSNLIPIVFNTLISLIPKVSGWYGNSVSKVITSNTSLKATSVSSAIFISIATGLASWLAAIKDLKHSMFIKGESPLGDRWVSHLRNTYKDYGINPDADGRSWENTLTDSAEYSSRLDGYANALVALFTKQNVTIDAIQKTITKLLPGGTSVTVIEPFKLIKAWPSARSYKPRKLETESDVEYFDRLSAYNKKYKELSKLQLGTPSAKPNTYYPVPVTGNAPLTDSTFESSSNDPKKIERINALKTDLGSYTNLGRTGSRVFPSSRHQGGKLEIVISNLQESGQQIVDVLTTIKAAGVYIDVKSQLFLGKPQETPATVSFVQTEWDLEFTGKATTTRSAGYHQV